MTETLKMLTVAGVPAGRRVAIVTASGMHSALSGDAATEAGLDVALPSQAALADLKAVLPDIATPDNPLDLTTIYWGKRKEQADCYRPLLADGYDVALNVVNYPKPGVWDIAAWEQGFLGFSDIVAETGVKGASVSIFPECFDDDAKRVHLDHGVAPLQGLRESMRAVANAVRYGERRATLLARDRTLVALDPPAAPSLEEVTGLDEAEAKAMGREAGLTVPEGIAVGVGDTIPFEGPYVVKLLNAAVLHKSDLGAVAVGLPDRAAAAEAMEGIAAAVAAQDPGLAADRFLVEAFICDAVAELLVGVTRVDRVGAVLTLATGGTQAELLADSTVVVLPAPREEIERAFDRLHAATLVAGWRGAPPGDRVATLDAIEALAALALSIGPGLVELEVNPLLIRPKGLGTVAVDMVVRRLQA